jgi:hypothetical protein
MLAPVVDSNRQADHLRHDHGPARPCSNRSFAVGRDRLVHLINEMGVDKRSFLN